LVTNSYNDQTHALTRRADRGRRHDQSGRRHQILVQQPRCAQGRRPGEVHYGQSYDYATQLATAWSATDTTSTGGSSYVYASGNLIVRRDLGETAIVVGDEQLVLDTTNNGVYASRYYAIGGTTVAVRTTLNEQLKSFDVNGKSTYSTVENLKNANLPPG
jgi:hypothetical protein